MSLQLWLGGSGSGKSHRLYNTIIKEATENIDRNYYVIVPEQFTLQTQRDIVMLHPDGGIINIDVLSFNRLSYRIFEEVGFKDNSGLLIDDMGKNLILRRLASEHADELKVIGKNLKRLGYITEVKSVISEFMQYGITDEKIKKMRDVGELNNRRILCEILDDLQVLYNLFKDYIKEKYTTTEELIEKAGNDVKYSEKLKNSVIVFDGFTGFTPVQYDFIEKVLKVCKDIHVTVLADKNHGMDIPYDENDLFFMSYKTVKELKHIAEVNGITVNNDIIISDEIPIRYRLAKASPMLIKLEQNIFRDGTSKGNPLNNGRDSSGDIQILTASNPLKEMSYVAVLINDLVRNEGYRYKDIAVVSGDLDSYMYSVGRVFDKYKIPYFIDKKQPILLNPFIEFTRSVMRVLIENYSFDAMFSYLKSSLVNVPAEDIDELENYCLALGIKGKKKWHDKFIKHTDSMDEELLIRLNEIREAVIVPFGFFDACGSVREYCEAIFNVFTHFDIQQQLNNRSNSFEKAGNSLLAKEYSMLYPAVIELLDKMVDLLGNETMPVEEFYELLNAGFAELRIGLVPQKTDYVQIGDLTRSRFRDIKALFFVGVNDGIIPMNNSSGGIISDIDREFFSENCPGVELSPTSRMQSYSQRLYLYMVMSKPSERLYLSYSRVGMDGNMLSPSYLINEIKGLFNDMTVRDYSSLSLMERVCSEETGLNELAAILRDNTEDADELIEYFAHNPQYADVLKTLINSAFRGIDGMVTDSVTSKIAHVIYGNTIYGSITRLEMYAKCAYEHFLQYGLKLKEREEFSFDMRDMGSVFHEVLEVFADSLNKRGDTWDKISDEEATILTLDAVRTVTNKHAALYDSFRSAYIVRRIERIMIKSVLTLKNHVCMGDFIPSKFEFEFIDAPDLSSVNFKLNENDRLRLKGRIDRMDLYEDDNSILIKIIDFKSGAQNLDLAAIYRGEQLQLVVYLNVAMESVKVNNPHKEVIPAGILYYHLDDPIIEPKSGDTDEIISEKILSALSMKGLVNSDDKIFRHIDRDFLGNSRIIPVSINKDGGISSRSSAVSSDDFGVISEYVNKIIVDMGQSMLEGDIKIKPGNCKFCAYSSICKHSKEQDASKEKISDDEVLNRMKEAISQ